MPTFRERDFSVADGIAQNNLLRILSTSCFSLKYWSYFTAVQKFAVPHPTEFSLLETAKERSLL